MQKDAFSLASTTSTEEAERLAEPAEIRRGLVKAIACVCPHWLASQRDDLVQSALLRILELQNRCAEDRTFSKSYLRKVAHAVLVDEIRRSRHRCEVPLAVDTGRSEECAVPGLDVTDPERRLRQRQLGQGIGECLRAIKSERRQALVLFLQGHSVPEAARILGWSHKKTENVVYRGRADLRHCLELKGLKP